MKRGFFLTFDALIALSVILVGVYAINVISPSRVAPNVNYEQMHYTAEDAMTLFSITKLKELDDDYVQYLLENTNLTDEDLEKNLVECVTILWAYNELDYAENLTRTFLDRFFGDLDYSFSIQDSGGVEHLVYSSTGTLPENLQNLKAITTASRLVSGYKEQALPRGYMARAVAIESRSTESIVIPIEPEGSAHGNGNRLRITKKFYLDVNPKNITNAVFYLSVHSGISNFNSNTFILDGESIKDNGVIIYSDTENCSHTHAWYVFFNITDVLRNAGSETKWHTLYIELLEQSTYNAHLHPGSYLLIEYEKSLVESKVGREISKKLYLDDLYSDGSNNKRGGVWSVVSINVPKSAVIHNVTLHLKANNVADTYDVQRLIHGLDPDTDIWIYFNDQLIYSEDNPSSDYELTLDLTSYVRSSNRSTNTLYININCYASYDLFWSPNDVELYSDPENDPNGSSYLYVNYTLLDGSKYRYGYLNVWKAEQFGGEISNPKTYEVNFRGHEVIESYLHIAQLFSAYPDVYLTPENSTTRTVYETPLARVTPASIFVEPSYYNFSTNNTFRLEDTKDTCSDRAFLPTTELGYLIRLKSQVPYGEVFDTEEEAIEDAINRLERLLEGYADVLEVGTYVQSPISATNVPSMYGPVIALLKVWV